MDNNIKELVVSWIALCENDDRDGALTKFNNDLIYVHDSDIMDIIAVLLRHSNDWRFLQIICESLDIINKGCVITRSLLRDICKIQLTTDVGEKRSIAVHMQPEVRMAAEAVLKTRGIDVSFMQYQNTLRR